MSVQQTPRNIGRCNFSRTENELDVGGWEGTSFTCHTPGVWRKFHPERLLYLRRTANLLGKVLKQSSSPSGRHGRHQGHMPELHHMRRSAKSQLITDTYVTECENTYTHVYCHYSLSNARAHCLARSAIVHSGAIAFKGMHSHLR